jgi:hypothetical protein
MHNRLVRKLSIISLGMVLLGPADFSIAENHRSAGSAASNSAGPTHIDPILLRNAIHLSAAYLNRNCNDEGRFEYRINIRPDVEPKPKYNILRHAGAIYALAMVAQSYPEEGTLDSIERSVRFLMKESVAPCPRADGLLAVWSYSKAAGRKAPDQAKLGGTGLALVALLSVEKIKPGTTSLEDLRKLGRFLLFMQKPDGSFYSKYIPGKGGRDDSWTSLYYPGEAALGLIMLYEQDPSPKWLQAAANAIAYLARIRSGRATAEADHWALLATAKLLPVYNRCKQPLPPEAIQHHAVQICKGILLSKIQFPENTLQYGCLTADGRIASTATRLEGLQAAITFLPEDAVILRKHITSAIHQGIVFLLRSQIRSGKYAGGFTRAIRPLPSKHPLYSESFNKRSSEIRIDYVQHALSCMIQYAQLFHN